MSKRKLYKNTDSAFPVFLNTNNSVTTQQVYKELTLEPDWTD